MGKKYTIADARRIFKEHGYELLETEYSSVIAKMKYRCKKHGIKEISLSKLMSGRGCKQCASESVAKKLKIPYETVREAFKAKGYELISTSYVNVKTKLNYICPNHAQYGVQSINYNDLRSGHGCYYCGRDAIRGSNNKQWSGGSSDVIVSFRKIIKGWTRDLLIKSEFKCSITGKKGELNVHHMTSFKEIIFITLSKLNIDYKRKVSEYTQEELIRIQYMLPVVNREMSNPVVMLKSLHQKFHKFCGGNHEPTSFEQLAEFKRLVKEGVISA